MIRGDRIMRKNASSPVLAALALSAALLSLSCGGGGGSSAGAGTIPAETVRQLPIHIVYVNHVEVESVVDMMPPAVNGKTYRSVPERYGFTGSWIGWEVDRANAAGAFISFHMSGAYAEQALASDDVPLWSEYVARGHSVGVHTHSFLRGNGPFLWTYSVSPSMDEIIQHWDDNHDLVASLVGADSLWVGESHLACPGCWKDLGYRMLTTEHMALLPEGQHITWLVERNSNSVITYPHFPQIGEAGLHGPEGERKFFDLRVPQLKKEFLMLYLEWLERSRLSLEPQVWVWGWANHGGSSTGRHTEDIGEMLDWLQDGFVGESDDRGNIIARFVNDHNILDIYEDYEASGFRPLPSPAASVNDQFPYMAHALADAGVVADLTEVLAVAGVRLFELERQPPEGPAQATGQKVYLLFRESGAAGKVSLEDVFRSRGIQEMNVYSIDVRNGAVSPVAAGSLGLDFIPLVLEVPLSSR